MIKRIQSGAAPRTLRHGDTPNPQNSPYSTGERQLGKSQKFSSLGKIRSDAKMVRDDPIVKFERSGEENGKTKRNGNRIDCVLGANEPTLVDVVSLYLPNKDAHDRPIANHQKWRECGLRVMADCFGGAAATPIHESLWVNPISKKVIREGTVIVYSFTSAHDFAIHLHKIEFFARLFGLITGQGEVIIHFQKRLYTITTFPS
jgi:hypothetical protein